MKYAFYPNWYVTKEENKKRKRTKTSLILLLSLMLLVILQLSIEMKNLITMENKINNKLALYNSVLELEEKKVNPGVQQSFNTIRKFSADNNFVIYSMALSEEALCLTFQLEKKVDYSNLVSLIERTFKIKTISPPIEYNKIFLVNVEVEKDEEL